MRPLTYCNYYDESDKESYIKDKYVKNRKRRLKKRRKNW